ncbi:cytochrome aa3 quinol oxidase subunit IV [Bacillus sp. HMF5848]|uniref:cytochrome aa3 quinol oxidase subunit IV n=1 Tax=Bacillus sp. HMF5848 TaxID=2495421 RepID=UPI000F76E7C0|nr:cytochrome aa3 quinol oxidase subunit IV [Bacillus sp. HMF5848]RSK26670.1 cytochrome aa3 quinol oxidase subunit IV [Bacillus sp. HMF5848]
MAKQNNSGYPVSHIIGFIASLVMTFAAVGIALKTNLSFTVIMWLIGSLAMLQAGMQLFMFMHVTEGKDGKANLINMAYSFFLAVVVVGGSIWILTSGHMAH